MKKARPSRSSLLSYPFGCDIGGQECRVAQFIHLTCCQRENRLRSIFLGCRDTIAVQFLKHRAEHKTRTFVPIDEGMVFDDTCRLYGRKKYWIQRIRIGRILLWPGKQIRCHTTGRES